MVRKILVAAGLSALLSTAAFAQQTREYYTGPAETQKYAVVSGRLYTQHTDGLTVLIGTLSERTVTPSTWVKVTPTSEGFSDADIAQLKSAGFKEPTARAYTAWK